MTPEEKSLLERTYKLAEENNEILKSIQRSRRISTILRAAYWIAVIVVGFGAYYFIQPYVNLMLGAVGSQGFTGSVEQAQDAANQLKDLFK